MKEIWMLLLMWIRIHWLVWMKLAGNNVKTCIFNCWIRNTMSLPLLLVIFRLGNVKVCLILNSNLADWILLINGYFHWRFWIVTRMIRIHARIIVKHFSVWCRLMIIQELMGPPICLYIWWIIRVLWFQVHVPCM